VPNPAMFLLNDDATEKYLKDSKEFIVCEACRLIASRDEYLGAELFFGSRLTDVGAWRNIKSPTQLIKAHFVPKSPLGLFVIAGDQRVLGTHILGDQTEIDPEPAPS